MGYHFLFQTSNTYSPIDQNQCHAAWRHRIIKMTRPNRYNEFDPTNTAKPIDSNAPIPSKPDLLTRPMQPNWPIVLFLPTEPTEIIDRPNRHRSCFDPISLVWPERYDQSDPSVLYRPIEHNNIARTEQPTKPTDSVEPNRPDWPTQANAREAIDSIQQTNPTPVKSVSNTRSCLQNSKISKYNYSYPKVIHFRIWLVVTVFIFICLRQLC